MKVAFVSTLQPDTNYFRYLALALQDIDVDIRVYADRNPKNLGVGLNKVHLLWAPGDRFYPLHILRQALRDKPNIVHLHHEVGMFGGPINASIFPLVPTLLWLFGFKVVTTIHAVIDPNLIDLKFLDTFGWPSKSYLIFLVRMYFRILNFSIGVFSKSIIVHTEGLKNTLASKYFVSSSKIIVVNHGVPETVQNYVEPLSLPGNLDPKNLGPFVLYFGYLHKRKGIETLIKGFRIAAASTPGLRLIIAGGDLQYGYKETLMKLVSELSLSEKIIITGFVTKEELGFLLNRAYCVVLPASYSIAASGPLAQIIASEKPVILTNVGVYSEEIRDGENGLLVELNDEKDLAEKLTSLLKDESLRNRLILGISRLHSERGWKKTAEKTLKIYEKSLK